MAKSAEAFRTISEVAEWLGVPAHVLRFWESKFTQVKPVKRAGGRRYYRPTDMALLGGIKKLLHDDGMTIKGVQKILREQGVKHVAALSMPLDFEAPDDQPEVIEATAVEPAAAPAAEAETADVPADESADALDFHEDTTQEEQHEPAPADLPHAAPPFAAPEDTAEPTEPEPDLASEADTEQQAAPEPGEPASDTRVFEDFAAPAATESPAEARDETPPPPEHAAETEEPPSIAATPEDAQAEAAPSLSAAALSDLAESDDGVAPAADDTVVLPGFLHRATTPKKADTPDEPVEEEMPEHPVAAAAPPQPDIVDLPPDPRDDEIDASPGVISALAKRRGQGLSPEAATEAARLRDMLVKLSSRLGTPAQGQHPE